MRSALRFSDSVVAFGCKPHLAVVRRDNLASTIVETVFLTAPLAVSLNNDRTGSVLRFASASRSAGRTVDKAVLACWSAKYELDVTQTPITGWRQCTRRQSAPENLRRSNDSL